MAKWVLNFGPGGAEGRSEMRELLGGKGANLAEMCNLGLPVPPGFTITTEVCTYYYANGRTYPADLKAQVEAALAHLSAETGKRFGDAADPLLVSVRSGARASMPGMMDTVLNLGLNDDTVAGLARLSGNERFAWDSYRRFIAMYSDVVLEVGHEHFEDLLDTMKDEKGADTDADLETADLKELVGQFKDVVRARSGKPFPQEPEAQLWGAIGAVFASWMNQRAITYRRLNGIPAEWGTAVNVQSMVFGNMGDTSATGVAFSRNPSTGENLLYGEFLINAQGEDVVAGIRTPQPLTAAGRKAGTKPSMEEAMPEAFAEFVAVTRRLERHYRDMQDIEFTIERGRLYMLQTRTGKRTAKAALKIAVDMASEGLITRDEAIGRVDPLSLDQLLHPTIDPAAKPNAIATGLPASPGAASGEAVFTADEAERIAHEGRPVILIRVETSPEDIHGMHAAKGILTQRGGMTSHAAVVARGMGRPCVSGAGGMRIDMAAEKLTAGSVTIAKGEWITIDGTSGQIFKGRVAMVEPELSGDFATLMEWADAKRTLKVRTNAETPLDARTARGFGAEGIGLCRTEHMFFDADRILAVRQMICADTLEGRQEALAKLLPVQRADFEALFTIMRGLPVTIRLLDPPLHEFLPKSDAEIAEVAEAAGVTPAKLKARVNELYEFNPMLGHRGCRLGITFPEIYEMQARAIFQAAAAVARETGDTVTPEVMIPLVALKRELDMLKDKVAAVHAAVEAETGIKVPYLIGTMIELPRAALRAGDIAQSAEFFSFGTNDLTQTTFGISRDDAGRFLVEYQRLGLLEQDPFVSLDVDGVGELVEIAARRGRKTRPDLKLGICGEHGGDPASIRFCAQVGLDYVSCSPYRVPIARLAAAQAALLPGKDSREDK